jgi:phenylpyruvate tautomerase PptA (4-oxalocrotonate tautomerase family)
MPMIDVYARTGTFASQHQLAVDLASTLMAIEGVPDIPMFRQNTAAFIHELPPDGLSNVDGDSSYVRVQVLTNAGALDRDKQLAVVSQFTSLIARAAGDDDLAQRTWVLLTEAIDGGWGLAGHANTNEELVAAARAQIAELSANQKSSADSERYLASTARYSSDKRSPCARSTRIRGSRSVIRQPQRSCQGFVRSKIAWQAVIVAQ